MYFKLDEHNFFQIKIITQNVEIFFKYNMLK